MFRKELFRELEKEINKAEDPQLLRAGGRAAAGAVLIGSKLSADKR